MTIDNEWQKFLDECNDSSDEGSDNGSDDVVENEYSNNNSNDDSESQISYNKQQCQELYISTQTKIFFLNTKTLDVDKIFWSLPVILYTEPKCGIIKKQMRIVCNTKEEYNEYEKKRDKEEYFTEKVTKEIDNPNARKIKFKDVRKLTIGISKKDIMNCHGKNKNAFINCFALIVRIKHKEIFNEIHVKVFNTGRLAIPGIVDEELSEKTKTFILDMIQPHFDYKIKLMSEDEYPDVVRFVKSKKNKETNKKEKSYFEIVKPKSNVLINSNFNCGYFINQNKLKQILTTKYKLNPTYDPSMYPGVKCKFYYNNGSEHSLEHQTGVLDNSDRNVTMSELDELVNEKYTKISFMIFRTGNCLIVGNCTKKVLTLVYEYVKNMLMTEYLSIRAHGDNPILKAKKTKIRKKTFEVTEEYYEKITNK
jgi:hypothetical protein